MDLIPKNTETAIQDIHTSWNKTVESLLETAKMLINYQQRPDWFQIKDELASRNIMKSEVLSMMTSIGRNSLLNDKQYLNQLPSSYNSLYHLSKMEDAKLKDALDNHTVTKAIRLEDVRKLAESNKTKSKAPDFVIKKLIISASDYKTHKKAIDDLLTEITKKYNYIGTK